MKFLTRFACVFVTASLALVKCLPAEETSTILNEVQKDILDFKSDITKINRETGHDHQYRDRLILKLNQTMSRYAGTYEKAELIWNYILEIFPMYLEWIRALEIDFQKEKIIRIESMTGLRNLNQENHKLKQELKSVIGVLTTLEENIKNQSQQLKELQYELKESKASEKDLRTTLMQIVKDQTQELEELQNEQKENKNQSQQLKELHDQLRELKASEKDQNQELKELQNELDENKNQIRQLKVLQDELKELKAKDHQIRLVQHDTLQASKGRLEIFYDGEWGTVCDDSWDDKDATVACRMLGFSYGEATTNAFFGEGSGRIVLDDVTCQGHESRLDDCQYAWRRHDCGHHEDAGVICKHQTSPDVRLHFELLEIFNDRTWGSVCDDSFGTAEATVACRMLEYRYGYTRKARVPRVGFLLDDVNCKGSETSIKDCQHNGWGMHNCNDSEAVGILCRDLANTDLRLTGGGFHNQGRIEIFYRGHWGTVCDDGWDDKDATVACRMLGFMYGKARIAATFGQGSGRIWLDDVRCNGNEANLEDCQHGGWGQENCFHHEDAGVVCQ